MKLSYGLVTLWEQGNPHWLMQIDMIPPCVYDTIRTRRKDSQPDSVWEVIGVEYFVEDYGGPADVTSINVTVRQLFTSKRDA